MVNNGGSLYFHSKRNSWSAWYMSDYLSGSNALVGKLKHRTEAGSIYVCGVGGWSSS